MINIDKIIKILNEGRKSRYEEFYYNYNPTKAPDTFKRMAKMRRTNSDAEIASHASRWSGLNVSPQAVRYLFNKHKDHPDYVPPLRPDQPRHKEDFKKTVIALHNKGHSYSGVADILNTPEKRITRNKIAGIIDRSTPEQRKNVQSEIDSGNEPSLYTLHKDKPIVTRQTPGSYTPIKKIKESKLMENTILGRISNILNEGKSPSWAETRASTIRNITASETPEDIEKHTKNAHAVLINAHNELGKMLDNKDVPLTVKKRIKSYMGTISKHVKE